MIQAECVGGLLPTVLAPRRDTGHCAGGLAGARVPRPGRNGP